MYWEVKINDQLISAQLRKQVAGEESGTMLIP